METIGYQEVPDRRGEGERRSDPDDVEAIAEFEFPLELSLARHATPEMPASGDISIKPALGSPDVPEWDPRDL